ncbi:unnamed protein product [Mucor hiemalis]
MLLCSYALMLLCSYALMLLCSYALMLLCSYAPMLLCFYASMLLCSYPSDGWAAYSGLHPSDTRSIASRGNNTIVYSNLQGYRDGNYIFRQHQVINHSVAYSGCDMVLGNNTVEDINTNMIEGVWKDIKNAIHGRNYNERAHH